MNYVEDFLEWLSENPNLVDPMTRDEKTRRHILAIYTPRWATERIPRSERNAARRSIRAHYGG